MKRLAIAAGGPVCGRAVDSHVKVVAMGMPMGRLHHDLLGACDGCPRGAPSSRGREEPSLQRIGHEDVLHARIGVGDQPSDELPVASIIEAQ